MDPDRCQGNRPFDIRAKLNPAASRFKPPGFTQSCQPALSGRPREPIRELELHRQLAHYRRR
jgi:hypothetical protein